MPVSCTSSMVGSRLPRPVGRREPQPSTSSFPVGLPILPSTPGRGKKRDRVRNVSGSSSSTAGAGLSASARSAIRTTLTTRCPAKAPRFHAPLRADTTCTAPSVFASTSPPDEGDFTPVVSRRKKRQGAGNATAPDSRQAALPSSQRPTSVVTVPKPRQVEALTPLPVSAPAPRLVVPPRRQPPPSVSVVPHRTQRTDNLAFRVPQQDGFNTSYDAVAALEEELPGLSARNLIGKDGSTVLVPSDEESCRLLSTLANTEGARVRVIKVDPQVQTTKGVVMGFPLRLPPSLLLRHPQVESATRCQTSRTQEDTRQVLVTLRGPLPPSLPLGNWGTFYLRPFTPEPMLCFRCQRFGHHQAVCTRHQVCGMCSGQHETRVCLEKYRAKQEVVHKCPNCSGPHHAWNPICPVRLQRVNRGREQQVQWVQEQQLAADTPAPPGTFVWGNQRQQAAQSVPQPPPAPEEFPPLPSVHAERAAAPTPSTPTPPTETRRSAVPASALPPPSPPTLTMTADQLRGLGRELAVGIAAALAESLGAKVDTAALTQAVDTIVERCVLRILPAQTPPLTAAADLPQRNPRKRRARSLPRRHASTAQAQFPTVQPQTTANQSSTAVPPVPAQCSATALPSASGTA